MGLNNDLISVLYFLTSDSSYRKKKKGKLNQIFPNLIFHFWYFNILVLLQNICIIILTLGDIDVILDTKFQLSTLWLSSGVPWLTDIGYLLIIMIFYHNSFVITVMTVIAHSCCIGASLPDSRIEHMTNHINTCITNSSLHYTTVSKDISDVLLESFIFNFRWFLTFGYYGRFVPLFIIW